MDRNKLAKSRRSYYDDYKKTASGEYIYAGPEYEFVSKNGKQRKRWMLEMMLLSIAMLAALMVPGFLHVPGLNYCAYVILPYAVGVLVSGYLLVVLIRLAVAKASVKAWEYDKSVKVLPAATVLAAIINIVNIVCESVYLMLNGADNQAVGAIVFVVCHTVAAAFAVLMVRLVRSAEWKRKAPAEV